MESGKRQADARPVALALSPVRTDSYSQPSKRRAIAQGAPAPSATAPPADLSRPNPRRDEKPYACPHDSCPKSFTRPSRLAEHIRSHTNERPFICPHQDCSKTFLRDNHLSRHVKSAHSDVRDHACDWTGCGKRFATGTRLRRHRAAHEEKERFRCSGYPPCAEIFRKHSTLQKHVVCAHLNQKPFPCPHVDVETGEKCGRAFGTAGKLQAHEARVHGGTKFWCTACAPPTPGSGEQLMGGMPDSVGFPTYALLQAHIRDAHPPVCDPCRRSFTSQRGLRQHNEIHHEGLGIEERRNFKCEVEGCTRAFTKKGNLVVHIRTVHVGEKRFVCGSQDQGMSYVLLGWDVRDACGAAFSTKANMEQHIRTQHLGERSASRSGQSKRRLEANDDIGTLRGSKRKRHGASTLAKLTGVDRVPVDESSSSVACTSSGCAGRFAGEYELEAHLRSAHGMTEEDAMEFMVERSALEGGQFWLGAEPFEAGEDEEEEEANLILDAQAGIAPGQKRIDISGGLPWLNGLEDFDSLGPGYDATLLEQMDFE